MVLIKIVVVLSRQENLYGPFETKEDAVKFLGDWRPDGDNRWADPNPPMFRSPNVAEIIPLYDPLEFGVGGAKEY